MENKKIDFFLHPRRFYYRKKKDFEIWVSNRKRIKQERKAKQNNYIFPLYECKARFYLPYYNIDFIQKTIASTGKYFEINNLTFVNKQWNSGIIGEIIKNKAVLDIGANIGNHTLYYVLECGANSVYCFEPVRETFDVLKKNVEINDIKNSVHLYNKGVGSICGKAQVAFFDKENIGGTMIEPNNSGNIDLVSIDELNITEDIGLVKIDVEGFELEVLKGMLETLSKNKPYITVEIRDRNFEIAQSMLLPLGYKYQEIEEHKDWRDYNDYLFYN